MYQALSEKMKDPVRLLISVVVVATIGLIVAFLVSTRPPDPSGMPIAAETSSAASDPRDPQPSGAKDGVAPAKQKNGGPKKKSEEDDIAVPVEGDPLVVTLLYHPELGRISIEQYNKDGEATGSPLKSGTQVQIPNPSISGEKIIFSVP